jgi:hypothetical protein
VIKQGDVTSAYLKDRNNRCILELLFARHAFPSTYSKCLAVCYLSKKKADADNSFSLSI